MNMMVKAKQGLMGLILFFLLFSVRNEEISEAHMFLILPSHEGQEEFEKLEKKLLTLDFPDIFDRMGVVFGDVLLPRMELKFSTNLGSYFSQIGKVPFTSYFHH